MDRERWQQIDPLLKSALSLPDEERARFLAEACGSDEELRREVESLVAHERAADSLEAPVVAEAARVFAPEGAASARAGQTVGGYRIVEPIGAGGMGEVYLAVQQRTGRRVALKLLPGHFTADPHRVRRFQQEARAVLALNHPNIVTVYDIEHEDGVHLIASELIEGETLRRRMSRAPLQVLEALDVAAQTAAALAAAHEAGVVHRDIKPENVMLRPDGYVKVLDFGLAKLAERHVAKDSAAPTLSLIDTGPGVVMGTVAYMSPEQARGLEVDARTDIWSLGVVLYEMLAGRTPFAGETPSDVLAAVLQKEPPPLRRFWPAASESLEWLVAKALTKDREGRYQTAKEFAADLKRLRRRLELQAEAEQQSGAVAVAHAAGEAAETTAAGQRAATTAEASAAVSSAPHRAGRTRPLLMLAAAVLVLAGAGYAVYKLTRTAPPAHDFGAMRVNQLTDTGQATDAAVSPDGEFVAYVKEEAGRQSLWLRQTSAPSSVQVAPPVEGQRFGAPLFSPDGAYIYYLKSPPRTARTALYRIPKLGGGNETKVADDISLQDTRNNFAISPDGRRLAFVRLDEGYKRFFMIADADGRNPRALHTVNLPRFLSGAAWSPDGKTVATVMGTFVGTKIVLGLGVEDGSVTEVARQRWNHIGGLAWLHDSRGLVLAAAERGDHYQLWQLSYPDGEVRRITNDVNSYVSVSVTADSKMLAAVQTTHVMNIWTAAPSKPGAEIDLKQLTFGAGRYDGERGLAWTPDGRIVYPSMAGGNPDLWIINADGTGQRQLTDGAGQKFHPAVTPDGRYVFFSSVLGDDADLMRIDIDGGNQKLMATGGGGSDISPDGRWVIFFRSGGGLWKMPVEGGEPVNLPKPEKDIVVRSVISPDGRLIASNYLVNGPNAVFRIALLPFEGGAPLKVFDVVGAPIRTLGWTPDGRALTYIETRGGVSNIVSLPLDGGPVTPLTNFKSDYIDTFAWSRDGRRLALARANSTSSVVLIGGFN